MARIGAAAQNAYAFVPEVRARGEAYARANPVDPTAETQRFTEFQLPEDEYAVAPPPSETPSQQYRREIEEDREWARRNGIDPSTTDVVLKELQKELTRAPAPPPSSLAPIAAPTSRSPVAPSVRQAPPREIPKPPPSAPRASVVAPPDATPFRQRLGRCRRDAALEALEEAKGNKAEAARLLGLSRQGFYNALEGR